MATSSNKMTRDFFQYRGRREQTEMVVTFILALFLGAAFSSGVASAGSAKHPDGSLVQRQSERLERLDETKLGNLIRSRNGKALFINVWATWCVPCAEEFPDIVRLADEMQGKKIDFVGVSGDYFEDELTRVKPFLAKQGAAFKCYIAKLEGEDSFINAFDKRWGGGIPATFIYDSKGQKKAFLLGKQSYARLKLAVEQVVSQ